MDDSERTRATSPPWLRAGDAFFRPLLAMPELALVAESCADERDLHGRLVEAPTSDVGDEALERIVDADVRANYATFLSFRAALVAAGSLEAYYLALVRGGANTVPPPFVDAVVAAIVAHLLQGSDDAFEHRAAQLLHRPQRIALRDGRVVAADRDAADRMSAKAGGFDVMRHLAGAAADVDAAMPVLTKANAHAFASASNRYAFALDLTHEVANDLGHGLTFTMTRANSGPAALARVLERWIAHFLGVATTISPLQRIDDPAWTWHIGLDVEATALLNGLYRGEALEPERLQRLIGLFRLDFADAREMRADIAGKPVYLGLATSAEQTLKLKPQNLLINLPLATAI